MSLFGFLKKDKAGPPGSAPLVWFELQVTPSTFRFAFTPDQPLVIGFAGEAGQKAVSKLIGPAEFADLYGRTLRQVDTILKKHEVLYLPLTQTEQAFAAEAVKVPGVHVRFAYADDLSWASAYPRDKLPAEIASLLSDIRTLARQVMQQVSPGSSIADAERINPRAETAHIKVTRTGAIIANQKEIPPGDLPAFLDALRAKGGEIAYSRENSGEEPTAATTQSIQLLMDAVMERKVPIRLEVAPEELL